MRVTQAQKEEIRGALMREGLRLFADKGFAAATVDEITRAAGVAKGTFFNHFKTKEDLALAAILTTQAAHQAEAEQFMATPMPIRLRLHGIFRMGLQWLEANPEVTWVGCVERIRRGREESGGYSPFSALLVRAFAEGQARGEIRRDRPAAIMGMELEGLLLVHIVAWHHMGSEYGLTAAVQAAVDNFLYGAMTQPGGSR